MTPPEVLSHGILFGLAVATMAVGLAGILLPMVPGIPLIWAAALGYALLDGWLTIDGWTFAFLTLLGIGGTITEFGSGQVGAHVGGASRLAGICAFIGGLVGLIVLNLPGMLLGAMLAVFLVEFIRQRKFTPALRSSAGWFAGWVAGHGVQLAIGALMIVIFVARVLIGAHALGG